MDTRELAPGEEGEVSRCPWGCRNAHDTWPVTHAQQLSCPIGPCPLRPLPVGLRQFCRSNRLLQFFHLTSSAAALPGTSPGALICSSAFLHSLAVPFVTLPEGLSLWHLSGCLVGGHCLTLGGHWALGTRRADGDPAKSVCSEVATSTTYPLLLSWGRSRGASQTQAPADDGTPTHPHHLCRDSRSHGED